MRSHSRDRSGRWQKIRGSRPPTAAVVGLVARSEDQSFELTPRSFGLQMLGNLQVKQPNQDIVAGEAAPAGQ